MGQCSTLPTEAGQHPHDPANQHGRAYQDRDDKPTAYHRYRNRKQPVDSDLRQRSSSRRASAVQVVSQKDPPATPTTYERTEVPQPTTPSTPSSSQHQQPSPSTGEPMQEDEPEGVRVPPPECAKRMRCYKLNLDSEFAGLSNDVRIEGSLLGPYAHEVPPLTYSASDDSSLHDDPTSVAIRTAQIFRGITVDRSGIILTQNARATRSNRGSKNKKGEKSRQAAKIDKANDLVEESILTGKAPNSENPANLVSLFIMGEYDEMKYLVRDGSKKLREASSYPDETLLALNRTRGSTPQHRSCSSLPALSTSRKRVSPATPTNSSNNLSSLRPPPVPQSVPPKLKGHPRDRPSTRRLQHHHQQHFNSEAGDPRQQYQQAPQDNSCFGPQLTPMSDSDWSGALGLSRGFNSIWNCGGTGEDSTSPTQPPKDRSATNPHSNKASAHHVVEGRNDYHGFDNPATHQVRI